ncbi:hypothetical protein PTKIN_Ptkin06aG0070400 [Pterospermum kingtungense]
MESDFSYLHLANSGLKFSNGDLKICHAIPGSEGLKVSSNGGEGSKVASNKDSKVTFNEMVHSNGVDVGLDWIDSCPSVTRSLSYFPSILEEGEELAESPVVVVEDGEASYVASVLGVLLYMDKFTSNQECLAFVEVCVLVDASKEIPAEIGVKLRGARVQVRVEVPWIPPRCSNCVQFGHSDKSCRNRIKSDDKNSI